MFGLGPWEIAAIMGVLVLLFGAKKLPELARGMGQSIREFRKGWHDPAATSEDKE